MTHAEFLAYEARRSKIAINSDGVEDENRLHREIAEECALRGWLPFHGSMAHRTHRVRGEPDFLICADSKRFIAVECKSKHGKLSPDQLGVIAWLKKLSHEVYVVSSIEQFRECVK